MTGIPAPKLVEMTPALASEILAKNTHNRGVRKRVVEAYASDMQSGSWRLNGEMIRIAEDGTLIDGQHRLHAVVAADVTVPMYVLSGLPLEYQETIDTGVKRTFGDVLKLRGVPDSNTVASVARLVFVWFTLGKRTDTRSSGAQATNAQLSETIEKHPDIYEAAKRGRVISNHVPIPASIAGLLWMMLIRVDEEDAEYFFGRLMDGAALNEFDGINQLRKVLFMDRGHMHGKTLDYRVLIAITIKAWNAYRDGREIKSLRFKPGGAKPETMPEPH